MSEKKPYLHWPPGFRRHDDGSWTDHDGSPVTDPKVLARLKGLALPPAWRHAWASEDPSERIQARGLDSRGRVQYRYSAQATKEAAANRFAHMLHFAQTLPALRAATAKELRRTPSAPDLNQVTALAVRLLDLGLFRVGTDRYVHENHTYGLTTLETSHVDVRGSYVHFNFVGKEHIQQTHQIDDRASAKVMARLIDAHNYPGSGPIFQTPESPGHRVDSSTVNSYIHSVSGAGASAKVFRTWGATVIAGAVMAGATHTSTKNHRDSKLNAFDAASEVLGNTPTMAKNSYVYPKALELGNSKRVRNAVGEAASRARSTEATRIFTDDNLQSEILFALLER